MGHDSAFSRDRKLGPLTAAGLQAHKYFFARRISQHSGFPKVGTGGRAAEHQHDAAEGQAPIRPEGGEWEGYPRVPCTPLGSNRFSRRRLFDWVFDWLFDVIFTMKSMA
jgi:hypothetical protein